MSTFASIGSVSVLYFTCLSTTSFRFSNNDYPTPCEDSDCIYPYDDPCLSCFFALRMKRDKVDQNMKDDGLRIWRREAGIRCEFAHAKGGIWEGGAEERDGIEGVEVAGDDRFRRWLQDVLLPVSPTLTHQSQEQAKSQTQVPLSPPSSPTSLTTAPSSLLSQASTPDEAAAIPAQLSPWLNTLFANTLQAHKVETVFTGGAEEKINMSDLCLHCFQAKGGWWLQHEVRCRFAHEEKEREERAMGVLLEGGVNT